MTTTERFVVCIRGEQYIIIDSTTGLRVGLAHGTKKSAFRAVDALNKEETR